MKSSDNGSAEIVREPNTYKNKRLSVSRAGCYEDCPEKFRYRYKDKREVSGSDRLQLDFGTCAHETLEAFCEPLVGKSGGTNPERLPSLYREAFSRTGLTGLELFSEGLGMLRRYVDTFLRELRDEQIVAVEKEFELNMGGYLIVGSIDRVDRDGDTAIVIDYKTNRMLYTVDELDNDLQMSIYNIAVRKLYPWVKDVRMEFHMLRHALIQPTERTIDDLKVAAQYIVGIGERTEHPDERFPARVQSNCQYCEYSSICKPYQEALQERPHLVPTTSSLPEMLMKRDKIALLANLLYAERKKLDEKLVPLFADGREVEVDDNVFYLQQISHKVYPVNRTIGILCDATGLNPESIRNRIMKIGTEKVDNFVKDIASSIGKDKAKLVEIELEASAEKEPQAPRIAKRKKTKRKIDQKKKAVTRKKETPLLS